MSSIALPSNPAHRTLVDPQLPAATAPFGIHVLNQKLFSTYRCRIRPTRSVHQWLAQAMWDIFTLTGGFSQRLVSQGNLNAPWGVVIPAQRFRTLWGKVLVGEFGNGVIVYIPGVGSLIDQMKDATGAVITNASMWDMVFGGGGSSGDPNTMYITRVWQTNSTVCSPQLRRTRQRPRREPISTFRFADERDGRYRQATTDSSNGERIKRLQLRGAIYLLRGARHYNVHSRRARYTRERRDGHNHSHTCHKNAGWVYGQGFYMPGHPLNRMGGAAALAVDVPGSVRDLIYSRVAVLREEINRFALLSAASLLLLGSLLLG